jgi:hypothetical protein
MNARLVLGLLGLLLARDALAERPWCRPIEMRAADRESFESLVRERVPTALDHDSFHSCDADEARFATIETVPLPSPDGAEFWAWVECWREKREAGNWECSVEAVRGFRLERKRGSSDSKVAISVRDDARLARKLTSQALALLEGPGKVKACIDDGRHPPMTGKEVRAEFADALGPYRFEQSAGSFTLSRGLISVLFSMPTNEAGSPRVDCWNPVEVLVTS